MKNKIIQNKNFIRILILLILTGLLITSISSIFVTKRVAKILIKKSVEEANYSLDQAYNTTHAILTGIYGDYYDLWEKDSNIEKLKKGQLQTNDLEIIKTNLESQVIRNGYVDNIYIIDLDEDYVLANSGYESKISTFYDQGAIELFNDFQKNFNKKDKSIFVPRYGKVNDKKNKRLISIMFSDEELRKGLIVNINEDKLSKSIMSSSKDTNMMIVDKYNRIISDGRYNKFKESYNKPYPKENAYNLIKYDDVERINIGKFAKDLEFQYLYFKDFSSIQEEVVKTNKELHLIFGIATLLNIIISIIIARKIYSPLSKLVKELRRSENITNDHMDEYQFLTKVYENLQDRNKNIELSSILLGSKAIDKDYLENIDIDIMSNPLALSIISQYDYKEEDSKIIHDYFENIGALVTMVSKNEFGCILDREYEKDELEELFLCIKRITNEDIYIGIGITICSYEEIYKSYKKARIAAEYAHTENIKDIIYYVEISKGRETATENKKQVSQIIMEYINNNYNRADLSSDDLSKQVNLSLGYLRQIFKEETGYTLNEYIVSQRIEKAKELLKNTELTAKDIASEVGFYEPRYFYTTFKKKTGLTSEEFRRS